MIVLNKLPKPAALLEAAKNLDKSLLTQDQVNALLRIWPAQDVIEGLLEENKNITEEEKQSGVGIWDKGEDYFLQILDVKDNPDAPKALK